MEFTPFEAKAIEALDDCKGAVKQCGKNAITHLTKAWHIRDIDKEMAIFRGITAEEEAASSLFYSLKNNRYHNADRLLFKEHTYKLGIFPFLQAIGKFMFDFLGQKNSPFESFSVNHVNKDGRRALELGLKFRGSDMVASPQPPLHFAITNTDTGAVCTFEDSFAELISGDSYRDALAYIKELAGQRNKILYASAERQPMVTGDTAEYLLNQKRKIFVILQILLLSDPWHKKEGASGFVQQSLDSFLLLLEKIQREDVTRPVAPNPNLKLMSN